MRPRPKQAAPRMYAGTGENIAIVEQEKRLRCRCCYESSLVLEDGAVETQSFRSPRSTILAEF